jgi:hypothetical protein
MASTGTPAYRVETPAPSRVESPRLDGARAIARLLDDIVRVPGTNIRVGLDPLLGLVPGLGDVVAGTMAGYLILLAARLGAPKVVLARMLGNVAIDSILGAVPFLGDLFDIGFKANRRNLALLDEYAARPREARASSAVFVALLLLALIVIVGGVLWLAVAAAEWLWGALAAG